MLTEGPWPDHVDHQNVKVRRLTLEEALVLGECVRCACGLRHQVDFDASVLGETVGKRGVDVMTQANAVAVVGHALTAELLRLIGARKRGWVLECEGRGCGGGRSGGGGARGGFGSRGGGRGCRGGGRSAGGR